MSTYPELPAADSPIDVPQTSAAQAPQFAIPLEQADRDEFVATYAFEIQRSLTARRSATSASKGLEQDLQEWWNRYELVPPDRELPFEGAANYRVPLTKWMIDSVHARLMTALTGVRPYWRVEPTEPEENDRAGKISDLLDYSAEHELKYLDWLDRALLNVAVEGTAIGYVTWAERVEHKLFEDGVPQLSPVLDETGQPMMNQATGQPILKQTIQVQIVEREDVAYVGPQLDLVPLEDFLVADWRRLDLATQPWVGHRTRVYAPELEALKGREGYFDEEIDAVLTGAAGFQTTDQGSITPGQSALQDRTGVNESGNQPQAKMLRWWEVWSLLCWYDWDNDGKPERVVAEIVMPQRKLIRLIKYPYLHNRPNYIVLRVLPRTTHFLGRSLAADLKMTQDETDALHNQRTDATSVSIAAMFMFLYDDQVTLDLSKNKISLGESIRVEGDINHIQSLARSLRGITPPGADLEQSLLDYAKQLSGIAEPQSGRTSPGRPTAFEINAVLQEGNVRFRRYIERIEPALIELGYQILALYQQHAPRMMPKLYAILNTPDNPLIPTDFGEIVERFNFRVHGAAIASNEDLDARKAVEVLQLAERSPVIQSFLMVDPRRGWYLAKMVFDKLGIEGYENIIGTAEQAAMMVAPAAAPLPPTGTGQQPT